MNNSQSFIRIKKILLLVGCLVLLLILGACTEKESVNKKEFEKHYFESESDNWHIKLEVEAENTRRYIVSYIGEGSKPPVFKYEINNSSGSPDIGEGELDKENEFEINVLCSGACDSLSQKIPIIIQWEGKKEKVVIRNK
ncbi:hypothetical protein MKZ26_07340 [Sporosarcina sp. FSL K6-6792]|uniref:hypothetical protein n=1 Tax=Sporosarcina sp. FSL K6-6792 TaxID=2921559 RepID=UPI0030FC2DE4